MSDHDEKRKRKMRPVFGIHQPRNKIKKRMHVYVDITCQLEKKCAESENIEHGRQKRTKKFGQRRLRKKKKKKSAEQTNEKLRTLELF